MVGGDQGGPTDRSGSGGGGGGGRRRSLEAHEVEATATTRHATSKKNEAAVLVTTKISSPARLATSRTAVRNVKATPSRVAASTTERDVPSSAAPAPGPRSSAASSKANGRTSTTGRVTKAVPCCRRLVKVNPMKPKSSPSSVSIATSTATTTAHPATTRPRATANRAPGAG